MVSLAVFCGSKEGNDSMYKTHAKQLGALMARQGYGLVYGGGNKGLMGAIADAVMENDGHVVGVIPVRLAEWGHHHTGITQMIEVPDMHTRKRMMYERCRAAVILPGGFGTMDEMFEMLTWNQLSIHDKPIFILNTMGYYNDLFQMMQVMQQSGFLHEDLGSRVKICDTPESVITKLANLNILPAK